ncbi:MAG TPA: GNAT family N-acetyltransferase [Candidatus Anoxymicrobiaceae bacterium]
MRARPTYFVFLICVLLLCVLFAAAPRALASTLKEDKDAQRALQAKLLEIGFLVILALMAIGGSITYALKRRRQAIGQESVRRELENRHLADDVVRCRVARAATPDDLDVMVRMQADFELEAFGKTVVEEESVRRLLSLQMSEGAAMVVEAGGRIVSKAEATIATPHGALVGGVYSLPDSRGKGHSTTCMAALCEVLLSSVPAVGLNVFVDNHSARRVYEKTGFELAEDWLTVDMA